MEKLLMIGEKLAEETDVVRFVELAGYEVCYAAGKAQALDVLRAEQPAIVIVDHALGDEDGVTVLKEVREVSAACEVILVTSGGEMDIAIEVLRAGALDYLHWPLELDQLRVALGRARERRKTRTPPEPPAILVLEDHEPTLERLVRILEKEGYRATGAPDGEEGMRLFGKMRFDLILADVKMPRKTGLEVLRETKGQGADVEVIVSSGYGDEDLVVQALREGAANFLKKPVDIDQLLLSVKNALDLQTIRRSLAYRNRDVELMQHLVVRLNHELELIVETPHKMTAEALGFIHHLVDGLPFGLVVVSAEREILFANRHVTDKLSDPPSRLSTDWLRQLGVSEITEDDLAPAFTRMIESQPGTIETLQISQWAFLIMTSIKLLKPDGSERFVALAIRGERKM